MLLMGRDAGEEILRPDDLAEGEIGLDRAARRSDADGRGLTQQASQGGDCVVPGSDLDYAQMGSTPRLG